MMHPDAWPDSKTASRKTVLHKATGSQTSRP